MGHIVLYGTGDNIRVNEAAREKHSPAGREKNIEVFGIGSRLVYAAGFAE